MKKVLFVTNRNVLTTSGELRLIKNRAESLYRVHDIATDFIVFSKKDRITNKSEVIKAGGGTLTYEMAISHPLTSFFSYKKVKKEIKTRLGKGEYGAVILSGFAMSTYAKTISRSFEIPILLDVHGASEDMLELAKNGNKIKGLILRCFYHADKKTTKDSLKYIDGFLVVTKSLKDYIKSKYFINDNYRFFIIPCATNSSIFNRKEYLNDRKKYREKYDIKEDELVFVYSGGISPWQCVGETIELYKKIADRINRKTRMLVFSHYRDAIKELAGGDERVQVDSYSPDELIHVLHAGDFAFLLRKDSLTNNVAFPNKYLEYVQSGMQIITTPYVKEIAKQVTENELGYIYDFDMDITPLLSYIQKCEHVEAKEEQINATLKRNSFSITTENFVEWFQTQTVDNV